MRIWNLNLSNYSQGRGRPKLVVVCLSYSIKLQVSSFHRYTVTIIPTALRNHISFVCHRKQSNPHYRPGQALRVPGGWGSQTSRQSTHEGGKVVSTYAPAAFTPQEIFLVLISFRSWVDSRATVRPEGLCQWKIPMRPSGNRTLDLPACSAVSQPYHRVPLSVTEVI